MTHTPVQWKAVEMGSEGWAVFMPHPKGKGELMIASNLTAEHAHLIADAPALKADNERMRELLHTVQDNGLLAVADRLHADNERLTLLNAELLEALEFLLETLKAWEPICPEDWDTGDDFAVEQATATIAKAKGQ